MGGTVSTAVNNVTAAEAVSWRPPAMLLSTTSISSSHLHFSPTYKRIEEAVVDHGQLSAAVSPESLFPTSSRFAFALSKQHC